MRPDAEEHAHGTAHRVDRAYVAGDVDTAASGKFSPKRMVVEQRMGWIAHKKILSLHKLYPHFLRIFLEILEKHPVQSYSHASN